MRLIVSIILLAASGAWAEKTVPSSAAPKDAAALSDQALEVLRLKAKDALEKKVLEIQKSHADRQAFAEEMTKDRVEFEKRAAADFQNFLMNLKGTDTAARRALLDAFTDKQRAERDQFIYQSRQKIDEFRRRSQD